MLAKQTLPTLPYCNTGSDPTHQNEGLKGRRKPNNLKIILMEKNASENTSPAASRQLIKTYGLDRIQSI